MSLSHGRCVTLRRRALRLAVDRRRPALLAHWSWGRYHHHLRLER